MSPAAFSIREDGRAALQCAAQSARDVNPTAYDEALARAVRAAEESACARRRASGACPLHQPQLTLSQRITRFFERVHAVFFSPVTK